MVKANDLRNETVEELEVRLASLRKEIYNLRSQMLENKSNKTHQIGAKRKEIARILTVKREKV